MALSSEHIAMIRRLKGSSLYLIMSCRGLDSKRLTKDLDDVVIFGLMHSVELVRGMVVYTLCVCEASLLELNRSKICF